MTTSMLLVVSEISSANGYFIGAVIAAFILAYLAYSLLKPEKF